MMTWQSLWSDIVPIAAISRLVRSAEFYWPEPRFGMAGIIRWGVYHVQFAFEGERIVSSSMIEDFVDIVNLLEYAKGLPQST